MWDKEHSEVKAEEEEQDGKNKKKKSNTKRGKRKAGETFKKNIRKIFEEKDVEIALDIEEAEEEEVSKKTRRGGKQNDEGSGEEIEEEMAKKTSRKKGKVNPVSVDEGKVEVRMIRRNGKKKAKARMI